MHPATPSRHMHATLWTLHAPCINPQVSVTYLHNRIMASGPLTLLPYLLEQIHEFKPTCLVGYIYTHIYHLNQLSQFSHPFFLIFFISANPHPSIEQNNTNYPPPRCHCFVPPQRNKAAQHNRLCPNRQTSGNFKIKEREVSSQ